MLNRLIIITIFVFGNIGAFADNKDFEGLYAELNNALDSIPIYDGYQQVRIDNLKHLLADTKRNTKQEIELYQRLFEEYSKFSYDSATVYLDKCLSLASSTGDEEKKIWISIIQARYYGTAGSYVEAISLINDIDPASIPDKYKPLFTDALRSIYAETGNVLHHKKLQSEYLSKSAQFRDELFNIEDSTSLSILQLKEGKARSDKNFSEALRLSDCQLQKIEPFTPLFSEAAFFRSCTYRDMGNKDMQKYWLILSSLSDIRNSIKDQASLWTLAAILAEEGNTELSYKLIRISHEGLRFYNAPLRYLQSVNILSMIDHNYQIMTDKQNSELKWLLWLISLLAILLLGSLTYIYRQMKHLNSARLQLHDANMGLVELNNQLNSTVESLNISNRMLSESNTVKDVYIGRFLSQCSEYMKKMDSFRSTILKKEKSGQLLEYLSKSRMKEIKAQEIAEFTDDFDKAFLHIIPTFIDDFNQLLKPEYRITPNEPFTLTTELRIFALIRLGITDSSKIAEFLHYSVQTIYNYRSMVKNNASVDRDIFEIEVCKIGKSKD